MQSVACHHDPTGKGQMRAAAGDGCEAHAVNSLSMMLAIKTWCPVVHGLQVEQLYNGLLDRADQLREEMGDITDNVSLRTALETIWNDMAGDARALQRLFAL